MPAVDPDSGPPFCRDVRDAVYVVIPAYNEAPSIGHVAGEVRTVYPNVVVVDDGSTDTTFEEATGGAAFVLRHVVNRGQGAALQTGIEFALRRGARYVVTFDADGQHRVEDIEVLLEPIVDGVCDITLGSRFLGEAIDIPRRRLLALRLGVLFTRIVSRVTLTDTHNGLRAFSRRAAEQIDITLDHMAHASQLIDIIRQTGLAFREVPVQIRYTAYSMATGQSARGVFGILFRYLLWKVRQ